MGEKGEKEGKREKEKPLTDNERRALNLLNSRNSGGTIGWWSIMPDTLPSDLKEALQAMAAKFVVKGKMQVNEVKKWLPALNARLMAKTEKWREILTLVQEDAAALKPIAKVPSEVLEAEDLEDSLKSLPARVAKVKANIMRYRALEAKIEEEEDSLLQHKSYMTPAQMADLAKVRASCRVLLNVLRAVELELEKTKFSM